MGKLVKNAWKLLENGEIHAISSLPPDSLQKDDSLHEFSYFYEEIDETKLKCRILRYFYGSK